MYRLTTAAVMVMSLLWRHGHPPCFDNRSPLTRPANVG